MQHDKAITTDNKVLIVLSDRQEEEAYKDQLIDLKNKGVGYDLLFVREETAKWVGGEQAEGTLPTIISDHESKGNLSGMVEKYDCFVFPELDLDNAARVATGMKGTVISDIIYAALLLERSILINENITGIHRDDREAFKTVQLPAAYQKLFAQYRKDLAKLGVNWCKVNQLAATVARTVQPKHPADQQEGAESYEALAQHGLVCTKKLITVEWVEGQSNIPNDTIYVKKKTIISPLAKDYMKEKGLTITYVD